MRSDETRRARAGTHLVLEHLDDDDDDDDCAQGTRVSLCAGRTRGERGDAPMMMLREREERQESAPRSTTTTEPVRANEREREGRT